MNTSRRCWPRPSEAITGIKVNHQYLGEGEVVQAVQTQMQTNRNLYDAYINDSDLIGTHSRSAKCREPHRLDGGRGQGRHRSDARPRRLHGQVVHDRSGRQALAAARPAVRQPLLVPQGLVRPPGPEGQVQGQIRLRARRSGQLVGLRGHRRLLHQRREGDRRGQGLRPHGLRQARARPRLAHDRCVALHGRRSRRRHSERAPGRRVGHPHGEGLAAIPSAPRCRAAAAPTARRRSTPSPSGTSGCGNTRLRVRPTSTSISRCRRCRKATSPSRSSGTRPSPPPWWRRRARATTPSTTTAIRCGGWRLRRTGPTGRKARSAAIRMSARGRSSIRRRSIVARRPGSMPSSSSRRPSTSRRAKSA